MLFQNEQKLPSVFSGISRKRRKIIRNMLLFFLVIAILSSIYYFFSQKTLSGNELNTESNQEEVNLPDYPSTSPAHISKEYSRWSIPSKTKAELWEAVKKSPINQKTGRHCIIYFIANAGMIDFILNSLCSMKLIGVPKNSHISVALDQQTYDAIAGIDEPVVLLQSNFTKSAVNNNHIVDFYDIIKHKPKILLQFLLW